MKKIYLFALLAPVLLLSGCGESTTGAGQIQGTPAVRLGDLPTSGLRTAACEAEYKDLINTVKQDYSTCMITDATPLVVREKLKTDCFATLSVEQEKFTSAIKEVSMNCLQFVTTEFANRNKDVATYLAESLTNPKADVKLPVDPK